MEKTNVNGFFERGERGLLQTNIKLSLLLKFSLVNVNKAANNHGHMILYVHEIEDFCRID